jgi:hypothetical protein
MALFHQRVEAALREAGAGRTRSAVLLMDLDRFKQTGLIREPTAPVLDVSMGQCRRWNDAGLALSMAINISRRGLLDPRLPDEVGSTSGSGWR